MISPDLKRGDVHLSLSARQGDEEWALDLDQNLVFPCGGTHTHPLITLLLLNVSSSHGKGAFHLFFRGLTSTLLGRKSNVGGLENGI